MSVAVSCAGQATSGSAPTDPKPGASVQNPGEVTIGLDKASPAKATTASPVQAPVPVQKTPPAAVPAQNPDKPAAPPGAPPAASPAPSKAAPKSSAKDASSTPADAAGAKVAEVSSQPYVIGPLDVLDIRVWNDQKLSGMVDVRPDGVISLPLIGEIKANGLTVAELTKIIADKLSGVFVDAPEVNIQPVRYNSKKFYIFGGVRRQGEFPLTADTTVLDGLLNGGGFTDFANPKKVYVLRDGQKLKFNYKEVSQGKHMEQNILLRNGDRIFVPE